MSFGNMSEYNTAMALNSRRYDAMPFITVATQEPTSMFWFAMRYMDSAGALLGASEGLYSIYIYHIYMYVYVCIS